MYDFSFFTIKNKGGGDQGKQFKLTFFIFNSCVTKEHIDLYFLAAEAVAGLNCFISLNFSI